MCIHIERSLIFTRNMNLLRSQGKQHFFIRFFLHEARFCLKILNFCTGLFSELFSPRYIKETNDPLCSPRFLARSRFLYPALIVLVTATLSFPKGLGMFMAGQLTSDEAITDLFSNTTWSATRTAGQMDAHTQVGRPKQIVPLRIFWAYPCRLH